MFLRDLPLESIRPILYYCDLASLVWLNATFDSKIQSKLRSRLAIPILDLGDLKTLPRGPTRYLVRLLQQVRRLELPNRAEWSPTSLALFSTLNPLELSLGAQFLHPSVKQLEQDALTSPDDPAIGRLMSMMKPLGFPNLLDLAPLLHSLEIRCTWRELWPAGPRIALENLIFPPNLTSLSLPQSILSIADINLLPPGLTHLTIASDPFQCLLAVFERLKILASLSIGPLNVQDAVSPLGEIALENILPPLFKHERAPATLTSLKAVSACFPSFLLDGTLLSNCDQLLAFEASSRVFPYDETQICFPPSLKSLKLCIDTAIGACPIISLPSSLTVLKLERNFINQALRQLNAQEMSGDASLQLHTLIALWPIWRAQTFETTPSTLTRLHIEVDRKLTMAEIESLPIGLMELHLAQFNLSDAAMLHKRAPSCHLHITRSISYTSTNPNDTFPLDTIAAPTTLFCDLEELHKDIDRFAEAEKLHFEVTFPYAIYPAPHTLKFRPTVPRKSLIGCSVAFKNVDDLLNRVAQMPDCKHLDLRGVSLHLFMLNHITRMDLDDCTFGSKPLLPLPAALTHLTSSTSTNWIMPEIDPTHFPKFVILDAPKWTLPATYLLRCGFENCLTLKCGISKMTDTHIVPFLTIKVSSKTRRGMSVSITAQATFPTTHTSLGIKLPTRFAKPSDHAVIESSLEKLKRELAAPFKDSDAGADTDETSTSVGTVGDVVNSLTMLDM